MIYSFDSRLAEEYGVDEAIFLHNLYFWIAKNEANGRHYYDGKSWTYNSMRAFSKLFPFWSKRQIERIINNLKAKGAIYVGNYNTAEMDRTQWYALHETVYCIYANGDDCVTKRGQMCHETVTGCHQTVSPIPDSKPDSKPDIEERDKEKRFRKPSIDEIRAYCQERKNGIDAEEFFYHYESKGWKIGKTPMRSWKAAIGTWEKHRKGGNSGERNGAGTQHTPGSDESPQYGYVL